MSYEIRTPLNAVLGFAELFNSPHDVEDEPVFAQEIKRNTDELLNLVNDILFISKLDAIMVEFNYKDTDFAALFEGYCYMGWSMLSPGVTVSAENPYSSLIVRIDEKNLCDVIQKLCEHAARNTTEGTIRAKYEYRHGELSISIEVTSKGIPTKQLSHLFDRFTKNESINQYDTGLEMPIIKELVEQMGGSIEIQSGEGKGTTAYIIVPCEMKHMEKRVNSE
jgi:signal transduction histidine kinase